MSRSRRRMCPTMEGVESRFLPSTVSHVASTVAATTANSATATKVVSARLITKGDKVLGAIVNFSGPMDAASTADPKRYVLVDDHKAGARDWLANLTFNSVSQGNLRFKSARYNPSENSLTLYLPKPMENLGRYRVGSTWNESKPKAPIPLDAGGVKLPRFSLELNGNGALARAKFKGRAG